MITLIVLAVYRNLTFGRGVWNSHNLSKNLYADKEEIQEKQHWTLPEFQMSILG